MKALTIIGLVVFVSSCSSNSDVEQKINQVNARIDTLYSLHNLKSRKQVSKVKVEEFVQADKILKEVPSETLKYWKVKGVKWDDLTNYDEIMVHNEEDSTILYFKGKKYNGIVIGNLNVNNMFHVYTIVDGLKNGKYLRYFSNKSFSTLREEGTFRNNLRDGVVRHYLVGKKIEGKSIYENGKYIECRGECY